MRNIIILDFNGIEVDDKDDWLEADWTEVTENDLKNSQTYTKKMAIASMKGEEEGFEKVAEKVLLQSEQIFSKYFQSDPKTGDDNKIEQFMNLCNETEDLKEKLKEEKDDNQRLLKKLSTLDSNLSSLLVNHMGNTISQEWDYVEASTNILKEKTNNCLNQSDIVQNSVETLYYGNDHKNVLIKIKGKI